MKQFNPGFFHPLVPLFFFIIANTSHASEIICSDADTHMGRAPNAQSQHFEIGRNAFSTNPLILDQVTALEIHGYCRTSVYPDLVFNRSRCHGGSCSDWFDVSFHYKNGNQTATLSHRLGLVLSRRIAVMITYKTGLVDFGDKITARMPWRDSQRVSPGWKIHNAVSLAFPESNDAISYTIARIVCTETLQDHSVSCDLLKSNKSATLTGLIAESTMSAFEQEQFPNISDDNSSVVRAASMIFIRDQMGVPGPPEMIRETKSME